MKIAELFETADVKFKVQQRDDVHTEWEDLADELYSRAEAQEFLDTAEIDDPKVEERAISVDGKIKLYPKLKNKKTKDVLARHASPEVHKRNKDFFDKHL